MWYDCYQPAFQRRGQRYFYAAVGQAQKQAKRHRSEMYMRLIREGEALQPHDLSTGAHAKALGHLPVLPAIAYAMQPLLDKVLTMVGCTTPQPHKAIIYLCLIKKVSILPPSWTRWRQLTSAYRDGYFARLHAASEAQPFGLTEHQQNTDTHIAIPHNAVGSVSDSDILSAADFVVLDAEPWRQAFQPIDRAESLGDAKAFLRAAIRTFTL